MKLSLLALTTILAHVLAAPAPGHVLHEKRQSLTSRWVKRSLIKDHEVLPIAVGLKQSNLHKGDALLHEISDPESPRYGQHMTPSEVIDLFAPPKDAVDAVYEWLVKAGITGDRINHSDNKQWLQFDATAEEANRVFKTTYYHFEHVDSGTLNIACDEYHLPASVSKHVDYITPGLKLYVGSGTVSPERKALNKRKALLNKRSGFDQDGKVMGPIIVEDLGGMSPGNIKATISAGCGEVITPECIQALYNFAPLPAGTPVNPNNQLGIFEDLGDILSIQDLDVFIANFVPGVPPTYTPTLDPIDGAPAPVAPKNAGVESDLDFQISIPIIYPQTQVLFQTDDLVTEKNYIYEGFLNNFFDAIDGSYCSFTAYGITGNSNDTDPPIDPPYPDPRPGGYKGPLQCGVYKATNVISISYGGAENVLELPAAYQQRQCAEIMKLGLQGTTVVVSSGDSGVATYAADPFNPNACLVNGLVFNPDFPSTCPYILAVGSTVLPENGTAGVTPETATTRFPSGGGFSNIYKRPNYQNGAVEDFFHRAHLPYKYYDTFSGDELGANGGIYNRFGRGYPDVSAIGDNVLVVNNLRLILVGGTSASAPVWASLLTRINEVRLAAGKKALGFVNPTLYKNLNVFNEITEGNNPGCNSTGFPATKGWDPVTGLGTPNYPKLLKLLAGLP